MKHDCAVVRDLLPLYLEDLTDDETTDFVQDHLKSCPGCRSALEDLRQPPALPEMASETAAVPLQHIKKSLARKRVLTIGGTLLLAAALFLCVLAYLTAPQITPFSAALLQVTENADGTLTIIFDEAATGTYVSNWVVRLADDGQYRVISSTAQDGRIWTYGEPVLLQEELGDGAASYTIYYTTADMPDGAGIIGVNRSDSQQPYTVVSEFNTRTTPRLTLLYFVAAAGALAVILGILRIALHKNMAAKVWLERALLLPAACLAGSMCIKGFRFESYALQRDFALIGLVSILLCVAGMLALHMCRAKRGSR